MLRVGFVDKYLNNWHSDHYPDYLRLAAELYGFDIGLTAAWAEQDPPDGGLTTGQWCEWKGIKRAASYEELIDSVDAIMVMCADDCLPHEKLAARALASGKPVYCDKTFAPDLETAIRMFDRAEEHHTPLFTCSAQRYCMELLSHLQRCKEPASFCSTWGPGDMLNYSIHQFEMIQHVMGNGAKRCKAFSTDHTRHVVYEYEGGRLATFTQFPKYLFKMMVTDADGNGEEITVSDYYMNFFHTLCRFFMDKQPPVKRQDTLEIMAMQQAARKALVQNGTWIDVPGER